MGMDRRYGYVTLMGSVWLVGCASTQTPKAQSAPQGSTSWHVVDTGDTPHYAISQQQVASGSIPIQRVPPNYPTEELAACPPSTDVQAQLIVDTQGRVSDVRVSDEVQASAQRHHYIDAVRLAALQWQFEPLEIGNWVNGQDGSPHLVSEAKPFSLVYVFHFECHNGQASTSVGKASST
jgi:hypothetical protein